MMHDDHRPLLPWAPEKVAEIKVILMLEMFGAPPPGHGPTSEMMEEVDREILRRFRLMPCIYHPN
jgi:hypothetical protein